MTFSSSQRRPTVFLNIALSVASGAALIALGIFAYLGTYTRYLADDYCDSIIFTGGSVLNNLLYRYLHISDRYSNILFVGLAEFIAPRQIQAIPVVMIIIWTLAFVWLVHEIKQLARLRWTFVADLFLGALLAFFSIYEAPNLFQTIYWRSALATHFAPLVLLMAFSAFLLLQIRRASGKRPSILLGVLCLVIAFFGGGFSEPPDAMLIVASVFALFAVWLWDKGSMRPPALTLLTWTLGGGLLALAVMISSPANSLRTRKCASACSNPDIPYAAFYHPIHFGFHGDVTPADSGLHCDAGVTFLWAVRGRPRTIVRTEAAPGSDHGDPPRYNVYNDCCQFCAEHIRAILSGGKGALRRPSNGNHRCVPGGGVPGGALCSMEVRAVTLPIGEYRTCPFSSFRCVSSSRRVDSFTGQSAGIPSVDVCLGCAPETDPR